MTTQGMTTNGYSTSTDQVLGNARLDTEWIAPGDTQAFPPDRHVEHPVDSQVLVDPRGTRLSDEGHPAFEPPPERRRSWRGPILLVLLVAILLVIAVRYGLPLLREAMNTVSTDDAFVAGHITNVSPRISGLVTAVMVDQNDRVEAGALLLKLDPEPFEIAVGQAEASLQMAKSRLADAHAQVRAQLAQARSQFYRRKNAQEQLRRQIAALRAQVATLRARESSLHLAEVDQKRVANLVAKGSATQSELDQRNNTWDVAREQVKEAWAAIQETRAALGLPPNTTNPLEVPEDLERRQSTVQSAVSEIASALAQVGLPITAREVEQSEDYNKVIGLDAGHVVEKTLANIVEKTPAVQVAKAAVEQATWQLDDAKRQLRYTEIRSEIAGYVEDRSVHPGNRVEPGQTLISIRPDYVWIDANFKETQIHEIRIGHPVDLYVDAYPNQVFHGRVAGFRPGTGLASSILPPENATGNYVKVVQRLPVRIELTQPNPKDTPLFAGLSVVPHVRIHDRPSGPDAGKRLRDHTQSRPADLGNGPASHDLTKLSKTPAIRTTWNR